MNIRFVRNRNQGQTVLGELYNVSPNELPEPNDTIWFDGIQQRVLSIIKSYEIDTLSPQLGPDERDSLLRICWFEVDIT